jgi:hypothetical protein
MLPQQEKTKRSSSRSRARPLGAPETSRGRLAPAPAEGDDAGARSICTLVHGWAMCRIAAATDSAVMRTGEKEGPGRQLAGTASGAQRGGGSTGRSFSPLCRSAREKFGGPGGAQCAFA